MATVPISKKYGERDQAWIHSYALNLRNYDEHLIEGKEEIKREKEKQNES